MVRSLKEYDIQFTEQFIKAFDNYYRNDSKRDIIRLVDTILKPYGGRLFVGFSIGKNDFQRKKHLALLHE
ncbi:hypothetical protein [Ornithinibacillus sp. FSL M8-0202]|uniref:hypothetical protein n=1 Tax=Ornithinibacillus sp. FSL M8-0202 TaxID=2921616 RepID=UPI0030CF9C5B